MTASRFAIAAALLALAGCSDPCSDGNSAAQNVANKFATCAAQDPSAGFFGGFSPCFDTNACETNLKSCTTADRAVLEAVASCQNAYANDNDCSFAGLTTYNNCAVAATTPDGGDGGTLSPPCAAAFANNQGNCSNDAGD